MDRDFNAHRSVQDYYSKALLQASRYAPHFRVQGDHVLGEKARHFGLFDCAVPTAAPATAGGSCC